MQELGCRLLPDFISVQDAHYLMDKIDMAPKTKWVQLRQRRLQLWGASPTSKQVEGSQPMRFFGEPLPDFLQPYVKKLVQMQDSPFIDNPPNQCLINEYLPGQGIMPHQDGPAYMPIVATISLGSGILLKLTPHPDHSDQDPCQIYLPQNSLFILQGKAYEKYLHGIDESNQDIISSDVMNYSALNLDDGAIIPRERRISCTFRVAKNVVKMSKFNLFKS